MRAIQVTAFGDPDVMRVAELADPIPGPREILVWIRAAGVNPVDTYIRAGQYASLPPLPYTPGMDGAGEVKAVGPGVTGIKPGERVYVTGGATYGEYSLCPEARVYALPDRVSFEAGAALGVPYDTAYRALFLVARVEAPDRVLVHGGSGGVGLAALALLRRVGIRAAATAGSSRGRELVTAERGVPYAHDDAAGLMAFTEGSGFDVILEMAAHQSLGLDLTLLAPKGRALVIGSRGAVSINPRDLMARGASVTGIMNNHTSPQELAVIHEDLGRGLADGSIAPVVGRSFPLDEAPAAHRAVMERGAHGKIVLIP